MPCRVVRDVRRGKGLEYPGEHVRCDARALIRHCKTDTAIGRHDADPNRASMRTEVYGVLQQCLDNLVYLQWIRLDNGRCRQFWSDSDGALSSVSGGVADHLPDYGAQIRHGIPKVPLAGLHGTQCAHLLYEVMQGDGALVYHVQEHAAFLGSHLSLCPEHL